MSHVEHTCSPMGFIKQEENFLNPLGVRLSFLQSFIAELNLYSLAHGGLEMYQSPPHGSPLFGQSQYCYL